MVSRINESTYIRRSSPDAVDRPKPKPPPPEPPPDQYEPPAPADPVALAVNPTAGGVEASASAGVEGSAKVGGVKIGGGLEVSANFESEVTREDGFVTFNVGAEASLTASGELGLKGKKVGGSVSASHTETANATYEVRLSEADFERFQNGEIPVPNPADPTTIPDGGSVRLDTANIESGELGATVAYHGAEFSLGSSDSESEGTSIEISRNGDQVQVSAGPTAAFESGITAGLSVGPVEVSAGNNTSFDEVRLRTASFDLSSDEGSLEFQRYMNTGELPSGDRPGVTNAGIIERANFSSQSSVDLGIAGIDAASFDGAGTSGTRTSFIQEDGSRVDDISLNYGGATLNIHNVENENGKQYDQSYHELVFTNDSDGFRRDLVNAFTGDTAQGDEAASHDRPITIRFSLDQMTDLRRRLEDRAGEDNPGDFTFDFLTEGRSNDDLAIALAQFSSNNLFISDLLSLSIDHADDGEDYGNLPGTVVTD
ncbi:MAG: hypothetical protein M3Y59_04675 [Myxococcota bacterium]|nr:hypothetical protein [Myxococcota bacterium]